MRKFLKYICIIVLLLAAPVFVHAAEVNKKVSVYESYESNTGGEISFEISGVDVVSSADFTFSLFVGEEKISGNAVEKDGTITVTLKNSDAETKSFLSKYNKATLVIFESVGTAIDEIFQTEVDISLPLSKTFKVGHFTNGYHGIVPAYDTSKIYYKYVLVKDKDILEKYIKYLKEYDESSSVYWGYYVDDLIDTLDLESSMPTDGWEEYSGTQTSTQPTVPGLYYIWMKADAATNSKPLVGCVFSNRGTLSEIETQLQNVIDENKIEEPINKTEEPKIEELKTDELNEENPDTGNFVSFIVLLALVFISLILFAINKKNKHFHKI